jgi:hypothetical protein
MNSEKLTSEKVRQILNSPAEPGLEYIADYDEYEREILEGVHMEVLRYGFELDNFCPYKQGQLTLTIGHYNLGKTTVILWLLAKLARQGKRVLIYSAENKIRILHRQFTRFFFDKANIGKDELIGVRPYVKYISHKRQFSYKDMLLQGTYLLDAGFEFDVFFIDPYNALKRDNRIMMNGHEYHYEAIEEFRIFTTTTNKSIFLNCHTVTEAQREKPDANGETPVPLVSQVEGGGKFPNKADDCMVIHRHTQAVNEEDRFITEIHVGKVRNQEFGGKQTPWGKPVKIKFRKDWSGFDPLYSYEQKANDYRQISFND